MREPGQHILRAGRQYVFQAHDDGHFRPVPTRGRRKGKVWGGVFIVEFDRDMVAYHTATTVRFEPCES